MGIFDYRRNYKPFEYPEVTDFTDAINKSFWVHSEVDFTADTQDFLSHLSEPEQNAVKNALLAIAQIEVNVKTFWGDLYSHLPKPEFNGLGSTFAECEFRHSEAYSRLLEVLGYNDEFERLIEIPIIKQRVDYLSSALSNAKSQDKEEYAISLILFSILIENVSLFSQFAIILSFTRFKGHMKNVSNIIAWTSIDEQLHANAGIYIINKIKEEHPEFFNEKTLTKITNVVKESIEIEGMLLDWIFEKGELDFLPKEEINEFIKDRFNRSLESIGVEKVFETNESILNKTEWFNDELIATKHGDFFVKRSINYSKKSQSITGEDLF
jgi:ribonucleoside-diphosphate reductase beta chain